MNKTTKTTATRRRVERRYLRQRILWLKTYVPTILGVIALLIVGGLFSYFFWYNYIPEDVHAAEGQAKVFIEYTVKSGDTLDGICSHYYSTYGYSRRCSFENEVIELNDLHGRINYLEIGQKLNLPCIVSVDVHDPYRIPQE